MHIRKQSTSSEMSAHCSAEKLNALWIVTDTHTTHPSDRMHYADLVQLQLQFQVQYKVHTTQLSTVNDSAVNKSDSDFGAMVSGYSIRCWGIFLFWRLKFYHFSWRRYMSVVLVGGASHIIVKIPYLVHNS